MGRGGDGVRELVDLLESYIEARIEGCASKEYVIVYGDGVCILSLLTELKSNDDDCILITPLTAVIGLTRSSKSASVGAMPDIQVIAVRKGSLMYTRLVDLISRTYHEGLKEVDMVVIGRSERECYVAVVGVKRETFNAEEVARAISEVVIESMVKASEWVENVGLYSDKREYLERLLERVKALRSCDR
jgi:hypothetical protein